jgi:Amt family ammonium transporter
MLLPSPDLLGSGNDAFQLAALQAAPDWLNTGNNAWQLAAGTFVALQSVPGLVVLYAGIVKKKWALNSAFMSMYAFTMVMIVWVLFAYNMGFGEAWLSIGGNAFLGKPVPILAAGAMLGQATVPEAASGMPAMTFPMATLVFFQFVFAAITVIILAGSLLGRMNFTAWAIFVPLWMTLIYTVGAFSLWGGGWLAAAGAVDFSGGYVIHLAAGTSGFIAAWLVGPRLAADRHSFPPNNIPLALVGAGILWLGWNGFNGGDPYFANANAGGAVLNTQLAAATALLVWTSLDCFSFGKPSIIGAINGMIAGLVAITPGAGYVDGWGALIIGICAGIIPWYSMNHFQKTKMMSKVDDTLSVFSTHGVAGLMGGLLVGILANPDMLVYVGTGKEAPGVNTTGWLYGNLPQLWLQVEAAVFIIVLNVVGTYILLKIISAIVPLRMSEKMLKAGDKEAHGEEAYTMN